MAEVFDYSEPKKLPHRAHFLPPEVYLDKPNYGKPVDIFSLAYVALHVMSHEWPEPMDNTKNLKKMK